MWQDYFYHNIQADRIGRSRALRALLFPILIPILSLAVLACGLIAPPSPTPSPLSAATATPTQSPRATTALQTIPVDEYQTQLSSARSVPPPPSLEERETERVNSTPYLGDGVAYQRQISAASEFVTTFAMRVQPSESILVAVLPEEGLDPILTIKSESGATYISVDENSTNEAELAQWTSTTIETIQIDVAPYESSNGRATIVAWRVNGIYAAVISDITDTALSGELNRYTSQLDQPALVVVDLQPEDDFDGVVEVYEPAGFLLNRDEGSDGEGETATFIAGTAGDYVFTVYGFQGDEGAFRLQAWAYALPQQPGP